MTLAPRCMAAAPTTVTRNHPHVKKPVFAHASAPPTATGASMTGKTFARVARMKSEAAPSPSGKRELGDRRTRRDVRVLQVVDVDADGRPWRHTQERPGHGRLRLEPLHDRVTVCLIF